MLALILVVLLLSHSCVLPVVGYGEPDPTGHPTYQERANQVFLNAVRIGNDFFCSYLPLLIINIFFIIRYLAPSQYKTVYPCRLFSNK
jgi:hypothetical protein